VTQLTSETIATVNHLTVDNDTRTYTSTQSNVDKVLHTTSHTVSHLSQGSRIRIVSQSHRNTQSLAEEVSQWHYAVVSPRKVRSELDGTCIVVTVRSTDTHALDLLDAADGIKHRLQSLYRSFYIFIHCLVATSLDSCCSLNVTASIYDAEH